MTEASEGVRMRLRAALRTAMKARDATAAAAVRSALAAIDNAEAVDAGRAGLEVVEDARIAGTVGSLGAGEAARASLTEEQMVQIVEREAAELRDAAQEYERHGHVEQAAPLRAQADVLAAALAQP